MINGKTYQFGFIPFVLNLFWLFGAGHFLVGNIAWGIISLLAPLFIWLGWVIGTAVIIREGLVDSFLTLYALAFLATIILYTSSLVASYIDCKRLMKERDAFLLNQNSKEIGKKEDVASQVKETVTEDAQSIIMKEENENTNNPPQKSNLGFVIFWIIFLGMIAGALWMLFTPGGKKFVDILDNEKASIGVCSYADAFLSEIKENVLGTKTETTTKADPKRMQDAVKHTFKRDELYDGENYVLPVIISANGAQLEKINTSHIICALVNIDEQGKRKEVEGVSLRMGYGDDILATGTYLYGRFIEIKSVVKGKRVTPLPVGKYQLVLYAVSHPDKEYKKNEAVLAVWDFEIIS